MKEQDDLNGKAPLPRQILISVLVLLALGLAGFFLTRQARSAPKGSEATPTDAVTIDPAGQRVVDIETAPVRVESLPGILRTTGLVSFPADQTVKISPRLQGRLRQVFVHVGDHVTAGQTLAVMDSVDAATAQTTARQNENKLRLAKANLERQERLFRLGTPDVTQAQANLDQAKARTEYTRGALERLKEQARIGGFTEKPLEDARNAVVTAKSALAQAESDLAQARRDNERKAKLVEIGVAAQSDLDAAKNVLEKAQVSVQADTETLQLAQQALEREQKAYKTNLYADQQVRSAESDYRQAQLQQEAADRALRLAKAAVLRDLEQAKSDYRSAQYDAENSRRALALLGQPTGDGTVAIKAPISGVVTERNVGPGQVVDQSQMTPWQMFTISNADTVWVEADVYEKDIARVQPGQRVRIRVAALPNREFSGAVRHIAPTLDPKTRAVKVRAEIANQGGILKDGMYADVTLDTGKEASVPVVPLAAIQHEGDNDYVYVAQGERYSKRTVRLGPQKDGLCVVEQGLKPGEHVVTHGAMFLGDANNGG